MRQYAEMLWSVFDQAFEQISMELKQHYRVEGLDDVRVIRDRQTSMKADLLSLPGKLTLNRTISSIRLPPIRKLAAGTDIYGTQPPVTISLWR
jgi:hypothetical protein